jgi:hypothetical protein
MVETLWRANETLVVYDEPSLSAWDNWKTQAPQYLVTILNK